MSFVSKGLCHIDYGSNSGKYLMGIDRHAYSSISPLSRESHETPAPSSISCLWVIKAPYDLEQILSSPQVSLAPPASGCLNENIQGGGEKMRALEGGRTGQIWRDGNTVIRPSGPWTPTVHRFLRHLQIHGFSGAPKPVEITENQEVVSYVDGRVCEDLGDRVVGSERMLRSAGTLLRKFHSASHGFLETDREVQTWMLPPQEPHEVVCHGDFAPYNIATAGDTAVGIIDFDTAHPAPAIWDVAYAVYRWAPLSDPANHGLVFGIDEQLRRANIFCEAYGATMEEKLQLPDMICKRLQALANFMHASAEAGDGTFVEDVDAGDAALYLRDIDWIQRHSGRLLIALK